MKKLLFIFFVYILVGCDTSKDKIYKSYKCAKAAESLGKKYERDNALQKAKLFYKDIFADEKNFELQLDKKFQDEAILKKEKIGDKEFISKTYESSECQNLYTQEIEIYEYFAKTENSKTENFPVQKKPKNKISENKNSDLEEVFKNFQTCEFLKVSYDIIKEVTDHQYFIQNNIKPYKVEQSLAFYKVDDFLYEMPISEIILPVTWALTSVTFDLPINTVKPRLTAIFGENFEAKSEAEYGFKPILAPNKDDASKTVLYCDEPIMN